MHCKRESFDKKYDLIKISIRDNADKIINVVNNYSKNTVL